MKGIIVPSAWMVGDTPRRLKFIVSSVASVASMSDSPCSRKLLYADTRDAASACMARKSSFAMAVCHPKPPDCSCLRIVARSSMSPVITCPPTTPRSCSRDSASLLPRHMSTMFFIGPTTGVKLAPVISTLATESRNT